MARNYRNNKNKIKSSTYILLIVLVLFIIFIFSVRWFRGSKSIKESNVDSIINILKPDPISQAVISGAIDTESSEAILYMDGSDIGLAKRGTKDKKYFLEIKSVLPEINREEYFYEVWLLSQLPYKYISICEMVTNDDGEFVIEWGAEDVDDNYSSYAKVVITLQKYNGSIDPQNHIVVGEFGK
jgi:hypothetical protein